MHASFQHKEGNVEENLPVGSNTSPRREGWGVSSSRGYFNDRNINKNQNTIAFVEGTEWAISHFKHRQQTKPESQEAKFIQCTCSSHLVLDRQVQSKALCIQYSFLDHHTK